jgi:branched-subunit amino acid transport protein
MKGEIIPIIIIGMGIVTYIPRWLPLFFLSRHRLPPWLIDWLGFIPAAILSALILPLIVTTGEPRHLLWVKPDLWVSIPTLIFALKTKSLAGTVVIGMALYWLVTHLYK